MLNNNQARIRYISSFRPLCETAYGLLVYKNNALYLMDDAAGRYNKILNMPDIKFSNIIAGKCRLLERMLRSYVRSSMKVDDGAIIVFNSAIYKVDINNSTVVKEHTFKNGMNNPLSFARISKIKGFDDCIAYGEYTGNPLKKAVALYRRLECGSWKIGYMFPQNTITHIHAIVPDPYRGNILILTGDADSESGIWIAEKNFENVYPLFIGRQKYRSCAAWPEKDGIIYATDTPLQANSLYFIPFRNGTYQYPEKLFEMPGPCIFSVKHNDKYYFSTSVEADSRDTGYKYLLSNKIGPGCSDKKTFIVSGNRETGFNIICSFVKDSLPMALFEFGNICFVNTKEHLYAYPVSVKTYDGCMMEICYG